MNYGVITRYHRLLGISWADKESNECVLSKIGTVERLLVVVARRKLVMIGHTFTKDHISKTYVLTGTVYGVESRSRVRFSDNIRKFGGSQSFVGLYRLTQDRTAWRAAFARLNRAPVN